MVGREQPSCKKRCGNSEDLGVFEILMYCDTRPPTRLSRVAGKSALVG